MTVRLVNIPLVLDEREPVDRVRLVDRKTGRTVGLIYVNTERTDEMAKSKEKVSAEAQLPDNHAAALGEDTAAGVAPADAGERGPVPESEAGDVVRAPLPDYLREHGETEPILRFFTFAHLPPRLLAVSEPFAELAKHVMTLPRSPERTVALRKLLEAKDAAVRAAIE